MHTQNKITYAHNQSKEEKGFDINYVIAEFYWI